MNPATLLATSALSFAVVTLVALPAAQAEDPCVGMGGFDCHGVSCTWTGDPHRWHCTAEPHVDCLTEPCICTCDPEPTPI